MYNPQLETFLCVAESGSFNKAAEKLYISPPGGHQADQSPRRKPGFAAFCPHPSGIAAHRSRKITCSGHQIPLSSTVKIP